MSLTRRLDKLEKCTRSKYRVGLLVETTPDGRCEIQEQLYWNHDKNGYAHGKRYRTIIIDSLELYEPPFNAEIDYIIGGMNEFEE